ncbi:protein SHORTAGE IN CHIASMATA 1 isoform X2 [Malania oleifera]|uniref:protein SHORTAGE IN CHIASMATA 1 isoform X2 n=1 Tax=Malania oleifera TaxID=397392 RepID=UPI0025AE7BBE|nr:protein SHORTAGE IN CHIASMATA 1 isoform X2 [Malania oleifera]
MRTRFLVIDYFTPSSLQTLGSPLPFLRLPLPQLPSPSPLSASEALLSCFDSVPSFSLDIESLPIHGALSRFLSDALPQNVPLQTGDFEISRSETQREYSLNERRSSSSEIVEVRISEVLYEEMEVRSHMTFGSETLEEQNEANVCNRDFRILQFETPELDLFLENSCFSGKEEIQIPFEFSETDSNMDMPKTVLAVPYPCEIHEFVYSVQDIIPKYHTEHKGYLLEGAGSFQDQNPYHGSFPLLEVDDISLRVLTGPSVEDEFLLRFESIEPQQWNQNDVPVVDASEILGTSNIVDMLEYSSDHCLTKKLLESELASPNLFVEMDVLSILETSYNEGNSVRNPEISNCESLLSVIPVLFEEFQFLDVDSSQFFDVFIDLQSAIEPEICNQMFREGMNFRNFNDLIVSHELALVDDTFKSMPVPILSDHGKIRSLYAIVVEILAELKPQPLSASDAIYLDWHLWEGDTCKCDKFSMCRSILEDIDTYGNDFIQKPVDDGMLLFDFLFSSESLNGLIIEENKVSLDIISDSMSVSREHSTQVASNKSLGNKCPKPGNGQPLSNIDAEKASLLFGSISQFNDLDFFLDPRKGTAGENSKLPVKAFKTKAMFPAGSSSDEPAAPGFSNAVQLQEWDIELHQVNLSENIVALINNFQKIYLATVENDMELKRMHYSSTAADCYKLLRLPKRKLMDCIKKTTSEQNLLANRENNILAFVTLCAIKQMAWYLCFYGIHPTHLYVDKLCQTLKCLKNRLSLLHSLTEDAYWKADRDITSSHPSLSVIQGILLSNISQSSLKVLIVTDQFFWCPLKRLLSSMEMSYKELPHFRNQLDLCDFNGFTNTALDTLSNSDCLLVSHKHISASFPFDKFGIILEYGGSSGLSRISTTSTKSIELPRLHFVKVELEDCSIPQAFCEGVDMLQDTEVGMEGEYHSNLGLEENLNGQNLEELLNFVPFEDNCNLRPSESADKLETCCKPLTDPSMLLAMDFKQVQPRTPSFRDTIIVVNTQNFEKEMIISRRRTYQRILAMEREGAQVVERDSNLPVDIIISAAICLVWYDCRNIGKKATTLDEASSCLALCIENISTNILTLLSFCFSGCILVFEGEISFLSAVMESSDGLYAAAASLGINLQLFCSHSSDLTEEIVLSCIGYATKLTRGLPKMPESETLAESFLTNFPSINALTAHTIISSVGTMLEFLEWPHEHRIQAIQKYHVPNGSVALLNALCRYGEREDSKSGMTDCCSASSAPDSEKSHCKVGSERKERKHIDGPTEIDIPRDDLMHFAPLNEFKLNPSKASKPVDSAILKSPQIFKKPNFSLNNKLLRQNQGLDMPMMKNLDHLKINNSEDLHEDFTGEVIDFSERSLLDDDFSAIANSAKLLSLVPGVEKQPVARSSKAARRLSFGKTNHPPFPLASEINSDSNIWSTINDPKHNMMEGISGYVDDKSSCLTFPMAAEINSDSDIRDTIKDRKHNLREVVRGYVDDKSSCPTFPLTTEFNSGAWDTVKDLKHNLREGISGYVDDKSSHPTFPSAAEINPDLDMWDTIKVQNHNLREGIRGYVDTDFNNENMPLKLQEKIIQDSYTQKSAGDFPGSLRRDKKKSHYGRTPFSNAIHSGQPQEESPWTIEFLNRIREKRRLRLESLPCDTSTPRFGHSGKVSNVAKRKSPSILDYYRYQGGRSALPKKITERKRQKQSIPASSSSNNQGRTGTLLPMWTPIDKRARQTLSFAMNGSGSQTRLVWSNENAQGLRKRFRNQT